MSDSLAPGFLVASPSLRDASFARSVVLLVEHGPDGSLGFIVNRPAPVRFEQVAQLLNLEFEDSGLSTPVFVGGPVAPQSGWILFDPRSATRPTGSGVDGAVEVSDELSVSASRALLRSIAGGGGPTRRMLALGYAGWSPGQLDGEFSRGAWLPVDLDAELVFDTPPGDRWHAALTSAGIDPARLGAGKIFSA